MFVSRSVIYIPTYGRANKQQTLSLLCKEHQEKVVLVCRPTERLMLERRYGKQVREVLVCKEPGVAAARQAAIEHCDEPVAIMLDDDLTFSTRVKDWHYETKPKAIKSTSAEITLAINWLEQSTATRAMACLGPRGGNNRIKERYQIYNGRIMRSFAVDVAALRKHRIRFDAFYYWEDFHVALCLLELGYANVINVDIVTDGLTNAVGGVKRNLPKMWSQAKKFVKVHPTARIREKEMHCPQEGKITVPDLTVYWKKALGSRK